MIFVPPKTEGAGKAGCRSHPWVPCNRKHGGRTTGSTGITPAFPAQWFTAYFVLSPVTGLFCHRHLAENPAKLDASVGASGPHGFAVRVSTIRQARRPRPPHPAPYVRDDRDTPLFRDGMAGHVHLIWVRRKRKYFCKGGWTRNH